jgi:hypothetical protein
MPTRAGSAPPRGLDTRASCRRQFPRVHLSTTATLALTSLALAECTATPGDLRPIPAPTAAPTAPDPSDRSTQTRAAPTGGLAAFPGAEGFGAQATGGRGGRVLVVTSLDARGPGTLQAALDETGPRTIVFRVSGVIAGSVQLTSGDVTIAGQTSPGGITVRGLHTTEEPYCDQACGPSARGVENFIIRHLRSRPAGGDFSDGLRLRYARNGIVDHMSIANASDEAVEISYARDITIQYTMLAETLGEHASLGGMLFNYSNPEAGYDLTRFSIHHNVWNRIDGRMPELSRESPSAGGTTMALELSNNLLWDPGYYIDINQTTISASPDGNPLYYDLNWVGNVAVARPDFPYGMIWLPNPSGKSSAYFADNSLSVAPDRHDFQLLYCCNDFKAVPAPTAPAWARSERHPFPKISYTPGAALQEHLLAEVGSFPRDLMDQRLLAPLKKNQIAQNLRSVNPAGDALRTLPAPAPPVDTDNDGMPDAWEAGHGLDPRTQDHNGAQLSLSLLGVAGYTNLECYLDELARERVQAGR